MSDIIGNQLGGPMRNYIHKTQALIKVGGRMSRIILLNGSDLANIVTLTLNIRRDLSMKMMRLCVQKACIFWSSLRLVIKSQHLMN
jgi:hypothetical protein